jgi:hypothetical protein
MNWGYKVIVAFVLFAAFIMYMVVRAFQLDIDLVSDDYYAQEIKHQDKMQQIANFNDLGAKVTVVQQGNQIVLTFPEQGGATGQIQFYHNSKQDFDKFYEIALNDKGQQTVSRSELVPGRYRVNISWLSNGKEYYQQEKFYVQ